MVNKMILFCFLSQTFCFPLKNFVFSRKKKFEVEIKNCFMLLQVNTEFLRGAQYVCERMQIFCKRTLSFSANRSRFARQNKSSYFPSPCLLRESVQNAEANI